ncbi:MAG: NAD-dependent epimerase/dehydratase family protein [Streptosporangiales bacterium]
MRTVVTGAAGFVGSHLCTRLLEQGSDVVGIDAMTDFYAVTRKEANIAGLAAWDSFTFHRADLLDVPLRPLLEGADVVFHLAGQPGVRPSWGQEFAGYAKRNILATQRLLEALRDVPVRKIVYSSSSSVYGDAESYPTAETVRPAPVSPYGVTKLAAEHLCELYRANFGTPTASLRLFTVYGPGQRPDMAFSRLIGAALNASPFPLFGDGRQTRDFTYVDDVVDALCAAALSAWTGVANIGGGSRTSLAEVIRIVGPLVGRAVETMQLPAQPGDVRDTAADTALARHAFGYIPAVPLARGLVRMVEAEMAFLARR